VASVTLSYKIKLFPTRVKADTLAALAALFQHVHTDATHQLTCTVPPRLPSTKGQGDFVSRAYRRAGIDWRRSKKAAYARWLQAEKDLWWALKALPGSYSKKRQKKLLHVIDKNLRILERMHNRKAVFGVPFKPPYLKAELIDAAYVQSPRKAKGFDLWIIVRGTSTLQHKQGFFIPAKKHVALNRTLALPGAKLNESAEVYRRNGKWYARISVTVLCPEITPPHGWYGVDVGMRASVTRSDGHQGPDLRPICKRYRKRQHFHAKQGLDRSFTESPQRQALSKEARRLVLVALATGRGVSLEDPTRLPAYKQWAARHLAFRVLILATLVGVPVRFLPPAYSSKECSHCGSRNTFRKRTFFRCRDCRYTANADFNSSVNSALGTYAATGISPKCTETPASR